jgi:hypothetical protein
MSFRNFSAKLHGAITHNTSLWKKNARYVRPRNLFWHPLNQLTYLLSRQRACWSVWLTNIAYVGCVACGYFGYNWKINRLEGRLFSFYPCARYSIDIRIERTRNNNLYSRIDSKKSIERSTRDEIQ